MSRIVRIFISNAVLLLGMCEVSCCAQSSDGRLVISGGPIAPFRMEDYASYRGVGQNTVHGIVQFRMSSGALTPCPEGAVVNIVPTTEYTKALLARLAEGVRLADISDPNLGRLSAEHIAHRTTCNSGHYEFTGLPPGDWLIISSSGPTFDGMSKPRWLSKEVVLSNGVVATADLIEGGA